MTTATASYDGSNGGAMPVATGTHTMTIVQDGTVNPLLSNSSPYRGTTALRWGQTTTACGFQNAGAGGGASGYFRQYMRIIGTPQGRFSIAMRPWSSAPGAGDWLGSANITIGTDRKLSVHLADVGWNIDTINWNGDTYPSLKATGETAIPSEQWVRVEGFMSDTQVAVKMWLNPASTGTPDVNVSVTAGSGVHGEGLWIGAGRSVDGWAAFAPTGGAVEVDEFAFDTAGYPGPLATTHTSAGSVDVPFAITASGTAVKPGDGSIDVPFGLTADGTVSTPPVYTSTGTAGISFTATTTETVTSGTTYTSTGSVDVPFDVTASATVTSPGGGTWTSAGTLDIPLALTADANVVTPGMEYWGTYAGSTVVTPPMQTWGDPNTWGDLNTWWSTT